MLQKIITISFYILFFFTPLFWMPTNYELFEYNKMMLVYLLTVIIVASWAVKMINTKKLILKRTPLDIPLLLFLLANILSTIFSIDPHTSMWGYYSRSNGGLLSILSYIALYYALVSNFDSSFARKILKSAIWGGLIVALWAVPEHFGVSPSCILLTGQFNASCWVQDVQARVFATLGQPNWLAAYLSMLIFPAIYFLVQEKNRLSKIFYSLTVIMFYLGFTFTYSRGGSLGLLVGIIAFYLLQIPSIKKKVLKIGLPSRWQLQIGILLSFLLVSLLFGSALTPFRLISKYSPPPRPTLTQVPSTTQLEKEGDETGQIRLIVWKGGLEIFKHYPILGSGVETFAYSYYNFRPVEHNLVSEWDFLYNKAHNEFLNYLATTGIVGFTTYMALIVMFIIWSLRFIINHSTDSKDQVNHEQQILILAILASYLSYLVQNAFGFSVVMIAVLFYLFPAIAFLFTDSVTPINLAKFNKITKVILYKRDFYPKLANLIVIAIAFIFILTLFNYYRADRIFTTGLRYSESGNPGKAYNFLVEATNLNSNEPFYHSELGFAAASAAYALAEQDATLSAQLKEEALSETNLALKISPKNVSYYRTKIRTYYMLANIDKNFWPKTLQALDETIALAPTDPKLLYNKALILNQEGRKKEAEEVLIKTITMKKNYKDAYLLLATTYHEEGQDDKAKDELKTLLKYFPNDPEALEKEKEWTR